MGCKIFFLLDRLVLTPRFVVGIVNSMIATTKVALLKCIRTTGTFRRGQRVWLIRSAGDCSGEALGRKLGNGKWILTWVRWEGFTRGRPNVRFIGDIDIPLSFAVYLHRRVLASDYGNQWRNSHCRLPGYAPADGICVYPCVPESDSGKRQ